MGGMDKGKPLTKRALPTKQVHKKGRIQKRVKFVRDIVREFVGYAPYEKRCMELLKVGKEKRALKVCKGSWARTSVRRASVRTWLSRCGRRAWPTRSELAPCVCVVIIHSTLSSK